MSERVPEVVSEVLVLITRPQPEAGELEAALTAAGLAALAMPAYRFEAARPGPELADFVRAPGRKLIVFTSKRAVEFGLPLIDAGLRRDAAFAAIGPATAAALEAAGCAVSLVPESGYTSEDLLQHPDLARNPGSALIMAAPGGRTALVEGLQLAGWCASMVYVYHRVEEEPPPAEVARLLAAPRVLSVWTSENAMRILAGRLPPAAWENIRGGTALVTSERLREALSRWGVRNILVSDGPGNRHLEARIRQLT